VLQIAGEEGWHALTMRKVAERIRYSAPMIYEVFESKEALCGELVVDGYQRLYRHMSASAAGLADPGKRLAALLKAFRLFAWENPAYYQAMYGLAPLSKPGGRPGHEEYASACLGLVGDALFQCLSRKSAVPSLSPLQGAKALIAAAHGVLALHLAGIVPDQREADGLFEQVVGGLLAGWGIS
jgi:AcrR family transcriptional regulator